MSVKAIREYDAKKILQMNWDNTKSDELGIKGMLVPPSVLDDTTGATWDKLLEDNSWVNDLKLVAKPDQLVKRRGKLGLVAVNMSAPALLDIESGNCREFPQQDRLFRSQMCASGSW